MESRRGAAAEGDVVDWGLDMGLELVDVATDLAICSQWRFERIRNPSRPGEWISDSDQVARGSA